MTAKQEVTGMKKKSRAKPAAIFLAVIAALIVIVIVGFVWLSADPARALRLAFEPSEPFAPISDQPLDYASDENWAALPSKDSFAKAKPEGVVDIAAVPDVDVFFIHPTTYLNRATWNAPLDDADANNRIENRVLKMQASSFSLAGQIYAPRYRQATFGAFFDEDGDGLKALIFAFGDVQNAFDQFVRDRRDTDRPFILAGHSQGALHVMTLLRTRIAGTPLAEKMIAAYVIGWPISIEADIAALDGIEACTSAEMINCVVSHQTFGPKGNTKPLQEFFKASTGFNGKPRGGSTMLCSNPLNWQMGAAAGADANKGAVTPVADDAPIGAPIAGFIGAQCGDDGFLYLDREPGAAWQDYKLAGENYHVYDYHMFYMNIRENAALRARTWHQNNPAQ